MNADRLLVFDTTARKVVANLYGFSRSHGVLAVPLMNRVYAPVTGEQKVAAVDGTSLQIIAKIGAIVYPDGIAFTPVEKHVLVSDEHGNNDAVIDAETNRLLKKTDFGGGTGNTVYDPGLGASWSRSTKRTSWLRSIPED